MILNFEYVVTPFIAWLLAGSIKFIINSIKARQLAFGQIGYGGLPSNHSAIVSSMVTLIAIREGIEHPAFGVALTLAFIVMLDANSLRRQVGKQAAAINRLSKLQNIRESLRVRIGHSRIEIIAGIILGIATAWLVNTISNQTFI